MSNICYNINYEYCFFTVRYLKCLGLKLHS